MKNLSPRPFRPKKSFGQNFLRNPRIIEKIISTANLTGNETILEVGPGFGVLTKELLKNAGKVIAIEKDDHLFDVLLRDFSHEIESGKLDLIHADALKIKPPKDNYIWVANIPYSITSPLLDHFIRDNPGNLPARAVLLVQKEVAEKICATPPRMNVLALHVQTFGTPKMIMKVSAANFDPRPKVDSAVIEITFHNEWRRIADLKKYFDLIHSAFSHKRKMLRATLPAQTLLSAGIEPTRRPETLSLSEWAKLSIS